MCSKGSGPTPAPRRIRLTVYLRGRILSHVCDRSAAALRLKWTRHLEDFKGYATEAA